MESAADLASITPAIRKLTIAVWALVIVASLNLVAMLYRASVPRTFPFAGGIISSADFPSGDEFANFHELPLEKQVQSASVIAFTTYKKEDGKLKSVITSIPKQTPGATFNWHVGDEYTPSIRYPRENTTYGEGEVMFFTGSPPMMRYSATYSDGRVSGLGDIPVQKLTEVIQQQK